MKKLNKLSKICISINNKAFTIVELIVVMAIIGILVLLASPIFSQKISEAKEGAARHDAKVLGDSAETYYMINHDFLSELQEVDLTDFQSMVNDGKVWGKEGRLQKLNPGVTYYLVPQSYIKDNLDIKWNNEDAYLSSELNGFLSKKISTIGQGPDEEDEVSANCNLVTTNVSEWQYSEVHSTSWPLEYEVLGLTYYQGTSPHISVPLNLDDSPAPYGLMMYESDANVSSICIPSGFTAVDLQWTQSEKPVSVKVSNGIKRLSLGVGKMDRLHSYDLKTSIVPNEIIVSGDSSILIEDWEDLMENSKKSYTFVNMSGGKLNPYPYLTKKYGQRNMLKASFYKNFLLEVIEENQAIGDIDAFAESLISNAYIDMLKVIEQIYPDEKTWTEEKYVSKLSLMLNEFLNYINSGTEFDVMLAYEELLNPPVIPIPSNTISKSAFYNELGLEGFENFNNIDFSKIDIKRVYILLNQSAG